MPSKHLCSHHHVASSVPHPVTICYCTPLSLYLTVTVPISSPSSWESNRRLYLTVTVTVTVSVASPSSRESNRRLCFTHCISPSPYLSPLPIGTASPSTPASSIHHQWAEMWGVCVGRREKFVVSTNFPKLWPHRAAPTHTPPPHKAHHQHSCLALGPSPPPEFVPPPEYIIEDPETRKVSLHPYQPRPAQGAPHLQPKGRHPVRGGQTHIPLRPAQGHCPGPQYQGLTFN